MLLPAFLAALAASVPQTQPAIGNDSLRVRRSAQAAQAAFERERRHSLPQYAGGRPSPCEERIGRFCYWYEGGGPIPDEPAAAGRARDRLLRALDQAGKNLPGDDWIVGQEVRYLVEHGEPDAAVARARTCGASPWWCAALQGFAWHAAERFELASQAFDSALRLMPGQIAADWRSLALVVDEEVSAARGDTLLWLADPLFSKPGNDLRTELLARRVMIRLLAEGGRPDGNSWGPDAGEMLLRYGWPIRWSVERRLGLGTPEASVVGHERQPAYRFFPVGTPPVWDWSRARPRSRYAPSYASAFASIPDHQLALFRRGDSTIGVAAFDLRGDTLFAGAPVRAALALARDPATAPVSMAVEHAQAAGVVLAVAPWRARVLSLEVERPESRRFAVTRAMASPDSAASSGIAISDLLLFEPGPVLPASLDQATLRALTAPRLSRRRPAGLYWEIYGASPGDTVLISIAVVPVRPGFLGRLGQSLGVVGKQPPVTLEWAGAGQGDQGRAIELDLGRVDRGRYEITIDAEDRSGRRATVRRPVVIVH